jgi:PAS domain S-box-containing protein
MSRTGLAADSFRELPIGALPGVRLGEAGLEFGSAALLQLFEVIPVAICITSGAEHRFVYTNSRYRTALFANADGPEGRLLADTVGLRAGTEIYELRKRVLSEGRVLSGFQLPVDTLVGGRVYFDITYYPLQDEHGNTAGILTFAVDVTDEVRARQDAERRAAEEANRTREALFERTRFALAVEATDLGIWDWNIETQEVHWSARQKEIWGLEPDAPVTYETWRDSLHPEDRERVLAAVRRTTGEGSTGDQRLEHRIVRPTGGVRWISSRGRMLYEEGSGRPLRLIGTVLDVTNRTLADHQLKEALAAKEVLLREVNHRVKNSLQLVSSMLSLQSARSEDAEVRRLVQEAQARLQVVAAVHERLYASPDMASVELGAFLETLCRDIERTIVQPGDALSVDVRVEPVSISNDRAVPLALILNELLTNAIKYAYPDRRGTIEVVLRRTGDGKVLFSVSDRGVGLPEDIDRRQKSSLGLRVINGLVRQIQGELAMSQAKPGSRFEVLFDPGAG